MKFSILALIIILVGCVSTAQNINHISVGMTKPEVIQVLGEPSETRASESVEYMIFKLRTAPSGGTQTRCGIAGVLTVGIAYMISDCQYTDNDYFVQLKQSKVTAYGRVGDFDSTQKPEATINLKQTVKEIK